MNCRFCGNFVPNGSESCPVCGRRGDERPIAELLAESTTPAVPAYAKLNNEEAAPKKKLRTSLILPTLTILVGVIGWLYILSTGMLGNIMSSINELTGGNTGISSGSEFETGGAVIEGNLATTGLGLTGLVIVAALSLILVIGVVMLFVRIANRIKAGSDD